MVIQIQSCWRGYTARKKVKFFSQLPDDMWSHILLFVKQPSEIFIAIDRIIQKRVTTLFWTHPWRKIKTKLHTLFLIEKYVKCLTTSTLEISINMCIKMRKFSHIIPDSIHVINTTLDVVVKRLQSLSPKKYCFKKRITCSPPWDLCQ